MHEYMCGEHPLNMLVKKNPKYVFGGRQTRDKDLELQYQLWLTRTQRHEAEDDTKPDARQENRNTHPQDACDFPRQQYATNSL